MTPAIVPGHLRELANSLAFPEGPVALSDGSVLVVEIGRRMSVSAAPR